jgi:hypothetical protein
MLPACPAAKVCVIYILEREGLSAVELIIVASSDRSSRHSNFLF